ncbi:AAA family ATPase [Rhizobium sp.]|uniref:AAA family ATPase n=1 Tax=Rhizobium sp. TaxID=391 RepID=UPI003F810DB5
MDGTGDRFEDYAVAIENFRDINSTKLVLPDDAVLIGDNNTGKSSVLEAIDLALGPDRLSRRPPVDEHNFYEGKYLPLAPAEEGAAPAEPQPAPQITVEVTIIGLSEEQEARLGLRLLTRTTRRVVPTEAGERLIRSIGPRIAEIRRELDSLSELREKPSGTVRLTASEHAAESILWPAVAGLIDVYPDIKVEIVID